MRLTNRPVRSADRGLRFEFGFHAGIRLARFQRLRLWPATSELGGELEWIQLGRVQLGKLRFKQLEFRCLQFGGLQFQQSQFQRSQFQRRQFRRQHRPKVRRQHHHAGNGAF